MNVVVITVHGSGYGLRLLHALAAAGRRADGVLVVEDDLRRKLRLYRRARKHVGTVDALVLAAARVRAERRATRPVADYTVLARDVTRVRSLLSAEAASALRGSDLVLLGQSGIVPSALLALPRVGTLNAHPGALPRYRGLDAGLWALADEAYDEIGSTLHLVDAGIDTGAVVAYRPYEWRGDETVDTLEEHLYEDCVALLLDGVQLAEKGALQGQPQRARGAYRGLMPRRLRRVAARNLEKFLQRSHAA